MMANTKPAFARRLSLSKAGVFAAIVLTCAALLAIAVAVSPSSDGASSDGSGAAISFEEPIASVSAHKASQVHTDDGAPSDFAEDVHTIINASGSKLLRH